jgi:hypothetical protein
MIDPPYASSARKDMDSLEEYVSSALKTAKNALRQDAPNVWTPITLRKELVKNVS